MEKCTLWQCVRYAQVTHSRITSPVLLRIKSHGWPRKSNFRSPIWMHYIHVRIIKYSYVWLRINTESYGPIRIATNDAGLYLWLTRRPVRECVTWAINTGNNFLWSSEITRRTADLHARYYFEFTHTTLDLWGWVEMSDIEIV